MILLAVFKKLALGAPEPTKMQLLMADSMIKKLLGIVCDVLVKVENFIFTADFVVLDYEVDFEMPIILGRPFLATDRALVDMERGELKFRLDNKEETFNVCRTMKQPKNMRVVSEINILDDPGGQPRGYLDEV